MPESPRGIQVFKWTYMSVCSGVTYSSYYTTAIDTVIYTYLLLLPAVLGDEVWSQQGKGQV